MVREGKINCILVKDLSRFGRNSIETGYFIEYVFPLYHVRFTAVSDDFDTGKLKGDTGGISVAFKYLINEYYSRDMSIKSKTAKYARMKRGEYQSSICPYGYKKGVNGRMEIDEDAAAVVRQIFVWAAEGVTVTEITRRLYRDKIPTPGEYRAIKGKPIFDVSRARGVWHRSTVTHILEDERYTGVYIMGKREVREIGSGRVRMKDESEWIKIPDYHAAIVEHDLYKQANASIRRFSIPNRKSHSYPLKGKKFCGLCDHAMTRRGNTDTYHCHHSDIAVDMPCHGSRIRASELEQTLLTVLKSQLGSVLGVEVNHEDLDLNRIRQADMERTLRTLQDKKRQSYELFASGIISPETYLADKDRIEAELVRARNVYAAVAAEAKQTQRDYEAKLKRQEIIRELDKTGGLTVSLADMLIERVYVFPGNRVEIIYKMQNIFAPQK